MRVAVAILCAVPAQAQAHLSVPGSNALGNGIIHPFLTPAHVLVLLALGLSLGQHPPLRLGAVGKVFAPVAALALLLTMSGRTPTVPPSVLLALALTAAAVVALAVRLPPAASAILFGTAAVAIGFDSTVEGGTISVTLLTLAGTWIALVVGLLNLAYYTSLAAEKNLQWLHIALRVAASWIIAIALLVLAFSWRKS